MASSSSGRSCRCRRDSLCRAHWVSAACRAARTLLAASRPSKVEVVTVSAQSLADEPEFIGQAESSRPVEIRAQVTGILKDLFFQEGRDVKKGAPLYRIDPVPFEAAYHSGKAKVAQAEARLVQAKQNLGSSQTAVGSNRPSARRMWMTRSRRIWQPRRHCRQPRQISSKPSSISTIPSSRLLSAE